MNNRIDMLYPQQKKKKSKRKGAIISEVFKDYCSNASLHGIRYLGAKDQSFPEKVWWVIVFILSFVSCSYLVTRAWIKWKTDPVILSFEKEQIPIWEIPFPAVTICPVNKVQKTLYDYTEMFKNRDNLTDEQYKEFWDISLVCNLGQYEIDYECTINETDKEAIEKILYVAPNMEYSIVENKWQNIDYPNETLFADQITEEGLCFTFNSLSHNDMFTDVVNTTLIYHETNNEVWDIERGYKTKIKKTDYPRRTTKDGIASGLSITLQYLSVDIDYVCGMPISGYKITLHSPAEIPKAAQQYFMVPAGKKANVIIKPELTKTSTALKNLPSETRKCYFANEKSLRFFKVYTQTNCRMECDANITLQYCSCVPFYLPHSYNTRICGFAANDCIEEVEITKTDVEMTEKGTKMSKHDKERIEYTREIYDKCQCLPSCNSLQYSAEISHSEFHLLQNLFTAGFFEEDDLETTLMDQIKDELMKVTKVDIFFKDSEFYALKRSEIYGQVDFLANIGGLLGLFMGFSVFSLLEIVYFLSIRIWFKWKNKHN